jgi:hypothetical protein
MNIFTKIWNWIKSLFGGGGGNSGPRPWEGTRKFFTCQFLLKDQYKPDGTDNTMQFFGDKVTDAMRQKYLDQVISLGLDSIFVFMLNGGGGNAGMVTFYKNRQMIGGEVDQNEITLRKTWLAKMKKMGIQPILCMSCCERDLNQTWNNYWVKNPDKVCNDIMPALEEYNPLWVSLLEAEKNVDGAGSQKLAESMCKYTMSPIGIHSSKAEYITGVMGAKKMKFIKESCGKKPGDIVDMDDFLAWEIFLKGEAVPVGVSRGGYDWIAYERGEDPSKWDSISPEQNYDDSKRVAANVRSPKRFMMFEYSLGRVNDKHARQGLAVSFCDTSKTFGCGSGCPKDLGVFMRQLPAGMSSTRAGSVITLTGAGITCLADLSTGMFVKR